MLTVAERSALCYIRDHIQEDIAFYPPMHADCPNGSTWATHTTLKRLHRKGLIVLAGLNALPVRLWITQEGLTAIQE